MMGEHTDALVEHIEKTTVVPHNIIVVNVGNQYPSKYGVITTKHNVELNHALMIGVQYARYLEIRQEVTNFAYWFILTSVSFTDQSDVLKALYDEMESQEKCVMLSPSFDSESNIPWNDLHTRGVGYRRTWGCDCYATLYRSEFFDAYEYTPELLVGWGMDLEMSYWANRTANEVGVMDSVVMHKNSTPNPRWDESVEQRNARGAEQMHKVLNDKYGNNAVDFLVNECHRISGV